MAYNHPGVLVSAWTPIFNRPSPSVCNQSAHLPRRRPSFNFSYNTGLSVTVRVRSCPNTACFFQHIYLSVLEDGVQTSPAGQQAGSNHNQGNNILSNALRLEEFGCGFAAAALTVGLILWA